MGKYPDTALATLLRLSPECVCVCARACACACACVLWLPGYDDKMLAEELASGY